jgi:hypothetical protein
MTSADAIRDSFPKKDLPKISGEPDYESIKALTRVLNANAMSKQTILGGGQHGYLGLTMNHNRYNTLTGQAFVPPINPGPLPIIPANADGPQIAAIERTHKECTRLYNECINVGNALKQQVLEAVDEIYLRTLDHSVYGFAIKSVLDIINHLFESYGGITPVELEKNDARIRAPYNVTEPFEKFVSQIEDSVAFAEAGQAPITVQQVLVIGYNILFATGAFKDECKEWRRMDAAFKTWPRMKELFGDAHKDLRRQQTAGQQGYSTANNVEVDNVMEALEQLAVATTADRNAVANLTEANAALSRELNAMRDLRAMFVNMQTRMDALQANPTAIPVPPTPVTNNNRQSNTSTNNNRQRNQRNRRQRQWCWTHGVNRTHNSSGCNNPAQGHRTEATLDNMLGSNLDGMVGGN